MNCGDPVQRREEIRRTLAEGMLDYAVQPIIRLGDITRRLEWMEWLVRPPGGLRPDEFVQAMLSLGLARQLDRRILIDALAWLSEQSPTLKLSINVTASTLCRAGFAEEFFELVDDYGVAASHLMLEIVEYQPMSNVAQALRNAQRLRTRGTRLGFDDVGTGVNTLAEIDLFPVVDYLKIDRSLLWGSRPGSEASHMLDEICRYAHKRGLRLIAEGVETASQHASLREHGIGYGQGYLYQRPVDLKWSRRSTAPSRRLAS